MSVSGSICWSVNVTDCPAGFNPLFCHAIDDARLRSSVVAPPISEVSLLPSAGWLERYQLGSDSGIVMPPFPSNVSRYACDDPPICGRLVASSKIVRRRAGALGFAPGSLSTQCATRSALNVKLPLMPAISDDCAS